MKINSSSGRFFVTNFHLLVICLVVMIIGMSNQSGYAQIIDNNKLETRKQKRKDNRKKFTKEKKVNLRDVDTEVRSSKKRKRIKDKQVKVRSLKHRKRTRDVDVEVRGSRPRGKTRDNRILMEPKLRETEHTFDAKKREQLRPQRPELNYEGFIKVKKSENPAKEEAGFSGNYKVNPNSKIKSEGPNYTGGYKAPSPNKQERQFEKLSKNRHQFEGDQKVVSREKTKGPNYEGDFKNPSPKAVDRNYEKLSKKRHQYEGDFRIKKLDKKDLHPSAEYRGGKIKNSREQKEKLRKRKIWWFRLKKNGEQPNHLKEKPEKPKYDSRESEIWYE